MKNPDNWPSGWAFYLCCGFLYGAALLRSTLLYYNLTDTLPLCLALLAVWLALFLSQPALSRRWPSYFFVYLLLQTGIAFRLLFNPEPSDFFALLFAILSAQIMQRFSPRAGAGLIALFTPLTLVGILSNSPLPVAIASTVIYIGGNALLGSYALAERRAREGRAQLEATMQELEQANRALQSYSRQVELLSVARERSRLARELHDSVTQSIFSMTLTTQTAKLLLERSPEQVGESLGHLNELAQGALAEMQTLIFELNPSRMVAGGLAAALRRHLAERRLPESLSVALESQGCLALSPAEERGLFRIVQESLNNVVKHAAAAHAVVRLHLEPPAWIEVQDDGRGFDLEPARRSGGLGLTSMGERAAEIGWNFNIITAPGAGTCIRLEKDRKNAAGSAEAALLAQTEGRPESEQP
jgi:signal transduction histidine kinase